jgi:hypothetical protein
MYNAFLGRIIIGTSTFKALITTNSYTENKDSHGTRADITNEVSGTGYTAGGQTIVPTLTKDDSLDKTIITFPSLTWANATITNGRKVIYYVSNGGAASGDWLFGVADLGNDYSSNNTNFLIAASVFTLNNS